MQTLSTKKKHKRKPIYNTDTLYIEIFTNIISYVCQGNNIYTYKKKKRKETSTEMKYSNLSTEIMHSII